jgi:PAS domain S-box-containing protein
VLVVDDVRTNREVAGAVLRYGGHQVIQAGTGVEALRLIREYRPDVVVTDVLMPDIDGYELVYRLRADPEVAGVPVVFYTSNYLEPEAKPLAEAFGVADVVLRTADPGALLAAVAAALAHGPVHVDPVSAEAFGRQHLRAVNTKLVEKVRALRESEQLFRTVAESSPVGIVLTDTGGAATYASARAAQILRLPPDRLLGAGWLRYLGPVLRADVLATAAGYGAETEHRHRDRLAWIDGDVCWLQAHVCVMRNSERHPRGAMVMLDDVTAIVAAEERAHSEAQRRQLDARLRVAERLDSLGRMAGGVAHDFNNILASVLSYLTFARESVTDELAAGRLSAEVGRQLLADLDHSMRGGRRAAEITQQLLAFGRRDVVQPCVLDLDEVVRDSVKDLAEPIGPAVTLELRLAGDLRHVSADPGQLRQILRNLVTNAAEAMTGGGTLTLATHTVGDQVRLTVTDTGCGMSSEVADRAVEPFFTTGGSAGLGLATVYGIVNQLGGDLVIMSRPGEGTSVEVYLPSTAEPPHPPGAMPVLAGPAKGGETVLVVDDEPDILDVVTRLLTRAGYRVLSAPDGPRALTLAAAHQGDIDLLLTDVVMPGMPGRELASLLTRERPDLPVLFMSGYAAAIMDEQGVLEPGVSVLPKPFSETGLLAAVRGVVECGRLPVPRKGPV